MGHELSVRGTLVNGLGWSSKGIEDGRVHNWARLTKAFSYALKDIADYAPGTLNVRLTRSFTPPNDESHRLASHQRAVALGRRTEIGADLLWNGNYVHPVREQANRGGIGRF